MTRPTIAARVLLVGVFGAGPGGCNRPAPPPPPNPSPPPQQPQEADKPAAQSEPTAPTEPEPPRPLIPSTPVSGTLDGQAFEPRAAAWHPPTLTFHAIDGRSIALVLFEGKTSLEILDTVPFGSPHVYIRTDSGVQAYTQGYRLLLDLNSGGIWIELPQGRGTLAGRFTVE